MPDFPDNWDRVIALARRQHYPDVADAMEEMAESDNPPDWIEDYYDGDVPTIEEDPSGPIAIEGIGYD